MSTYFSSVTKIKVLADVFQLQPGYSQVRARIK